MTDHTVTTNLNSNSFSYSWSIKVLLDTTEYVDSPIFETGCGSEWTIVFGRVAGQYRIWLYSIRRPRWFGLAKVAAHFLLIKLNNERKSTKPYYYNFDQVRNLLDRKNEHSIFISNDPLRTKRVEVNLEVICKLKIFHRNYNFYKTVRKSDDEMRRDFGNMLEGDSHSDLTICAGDEKFRVHRSILAARSPVFKAMFMNPMKESNSGVISLTDISANVLEELLFYIYRGDSVLESYLDKKKEWQETDQELVVELFKASVKYQLETLQSICELALFDFLSTRSIIKLLCIAEMYSADQLKSESIKYMINHPGQVTEDDLLGVTTEHPRLVLDIFKTFSVQFGPKTVT